MRYRISNIVQLALATFMGLAGTALAAPPGPPTAASMPSVPVGGPGVVIATTLVMAGYGIWKARK